MTLVTSLHLLDKRRNKRQWSELAVQRPLREVILLLLTFRSLQQRYEGKNHKPERHPHYRFYLLQLKLKKGFHFYGILSSIPGNIMKSFPQVLLCLTTAVVPPSFHALIHPLLFRSREESFRFHGQDHFASCKFLRMINDVSSKSSYQTSGKEKKKKCSGPSQMRL